MFNPVSQTVRSITQAFFVMLLAMAISACGYKGPLYLPPPPDTLGGQDNSPDAGSLPNAEERRGEPAAIEEESLLSPPPVLTE
ncbi:hypothetical protein DBV39_13965 [Orrella marina]|uniref:Lipoprotein n=1 Tax=Orrella marina TaxID=2163011 RepID=A0A2R4XLF1_9BURK|nr:hypothetical protein DBV39_13965 [Orrella marina]